MYNNHPTLVVINEIDIMFSHITFLYDIYHQEVSSELEMHTQYPQNFVVELKTHSRMLIKYILCE